MTPPLTPFQKLVLRALAILIGSALWGRAPNYGEAEQMLRDLDEFTAPSGPWHSTWS